MTWLIICGALRVAVATAYVVLGTTATATAYTLAIPFAVVVLVVSLYDVSGIRRRR